MRNMSTEEWRAFASYGTRTGKLATTRADGSPHVAPVWFVLDGIQIVFTTGSGTVKGRNLTRDPRAAFCVDDEDSPYSFVMFQGPVALSEDLTELQAWATRIAARYMGEGAAEQFGERNAVPGELLVRLTPAHVVAHAALAE